VPTYAAIQDAAQRIRDGVIETPEYAERR